MADGDQAHHVGDDCPGGHRADPFEASRLNDEQLKDVADGLLGPEPPRGVLTDRQAALFAAVQIEAAHPGWGVTNRADTFLAWLERDQGEDFDG